MKKAPELTDGVVKLNGYEMADVNAHLEGDDSENQKWLNDRQKSTEETVKRAIDEWQSDWEEGKPRRTWAVRESETGILVGGCEIRIKGSGIADCSYWTFPNYRRKGYARRALELVVDFAFANLDVERVEVYIDAENRASVRTAIAAGFEPEGILRKQGTIGDERRDMLIASRLKASLMNTSVDLRSVLAGIRDSNCAATKRDR